MSWKKQAKTTSVVQPSRSANIAALVKDERIRKSGLVWQEPGVLCFVFFLVTKIKHNLALSQNNVLLYHYPLDLYHMLSLINWLADVVLLSKIFIQLKYSIDVHFFLTQNKIKRKK